MRKRGFSVELLNREILAHRYELLSVVGEGSFSIVYKAYDRDSGKIVAVKELKTGGLGAEYRKEAEEFFFREIEFLKRLRHPAIPKFYDFFFENERLFMVMEYINGTDLLTLISEEGLLPSDKAYNLMLQLSNALVYLQDRNTPVIYKDLKPSNLILTKDGQLKIIDFGAARYLSNMRKEDTFKLGTPGYAPPEAYGRGRTDLSADVYSFGATFFHLITGEEPLQFHFVFPTLSKLNKNINKKLALIIDDCLKLRDQRLSDAKELHERLLMANPLNDTGNFADKIFSVISKIEGKKFRATLATLIVIFSIFTAYFVPHFLAAMRAPQYDQCITNMKTISSALERYHQKNNKYPISLGRLKVSGYMKSIPTCPNAGRNSYSTTYTVSADREKYTFCCGGSNHFNSGINEPGYPCYSSERGIIKE